MQPPSSNCFYLHLQSFWLMTSALSRLKLKETGRELIAGPRKDLMYNKSELNQKKHPMLNYVLFVRRYFIRLQTLTLWLPEILSEVAVGVV